MNRRIRLVRSMLATLAMMVAFACSSALSGRTLATAAESITTLQKAESAEIKSLREYWLTLPKEYALKSRSWPTIILLHGDWHMRAAGCDVELLRHNGTAAHATAIGDFPFIVIVPQSEAGFPPQEVVKLLDEVARKYRIDKSRVYLTGGSGGGAATYNTVRKFGSRFAAAAPICSVGLEHQAPEMNNMPFWIFHGAVDGTIPVSFSDNMVKALKKFRKDDGSVRYTRYEHIGHWGDGVAWMDPDLYAWFLEHRVMPDGKRVRQPLTDDQKNDPTLKRTLAYLARAKLWYHFRTEIKETRPGYFKVAAPLTNTLAEPLRVQFVWERHEQTTRPSPWNISPSKSDVVVLAPGKSVEFTFEAEADTKEYLLPVPELKIVEHAADSRHDRCSKALPLNVEMYLQKHEHQLKIHALHTPDAPAIDGELSDSAWKREPITGHFFHASSGRVAASPATRSWIAWDKEAIYLALRCDEPHISKLKTKAKNGGPVYTDDSVEFFLGEPDKLPFLQFVVNANNKFYTTNATIPVKHATRIGKDHWITEIKIRWRDMKHKDACPNKPLRVLLARTRPPKLDGASPLATEFYQFPPTNGRNNRPSRHATLRFIKGEGNR